MIRTKKKYITWAIILIALTLLCVTAFWQGLTVTTYTETTGKITAPIRIAVISDLHSTIYGDKQETLIDAIRGQKPDVILLTGDIADDKVPHDGTVQLLSSIGGQYPCYYVSGNHEYWSGEIDAIKDMIRSYGVTILEGDTEILTLNDQKIRISGVDDPYAFISASTIKNETAKTWEEQLDACKSETGDNIYSILLSHRPERADDYQNCGFDLVLSGHAHGGQVRVPVILNGLYAPNQGYFPEYTGGRYPLGETAMIVSRGLCRNNLPRVFNPPELVIVELNPEN